MICQIETQKTSPTCYYNFVHGIDDAIFLFKQGVWVGIVFILFKVK